MSDLAVGVHGVVVLGSNTGSASIGVDMVEGNGLRGSAEAVLRESKLDGEAG